MLQRKILLASLGADPEKGVLRSELLARFEVRSRKLASRRDVEQAIAALRADGLLSDVERARGARALRPTPSAWTEALALRYDQRPIAAGRFTGRQIEEALAPFRRALQEAQTAHGAGDAVRTSPPLAAPPAASVADGNGPTLEARILGTASGIIARESPPGRLVPVHRLRTAIGGDERSFDRALWSLAQSNRGTLAKLNDEALASHDERDRSFRHPFTRALLFYFRPADAT